MQSQSHGQCFTDLWGNLGLVCLWLWDLLRSWLALLNHSEVYLTFLLLNLKLGYFSRHICIHITQIKSVKPPNNIKVVISTNMQSHKHVKYFF